MQLKFHNAPYNVSIRKAVLLLLIIFCLIPACKKDNNPVSSEILDVSGIWRGTFSSNLVSNIQLTLNLTQSSANVAGTYSSQSGGSGAVGGTLSGNEIIDFTLTQTTSGCTGAFIGTANVSGDTIGFIFSGSDCLGNHSNGNGRVVRNSVPSTYDTNSVFIKISLANIPPLLTFNQSHVTTRGVEYWWSISFNTDNIDSTGLDGFDIEIALVHSKDDSNSVQSSIIEGTKHQVIEWIDTLGRTVGKVRHNDIPAWIDSNDPNTLIIAASESFSEVSRINENVPFYIYTYYRTPDPPSGTDRTSTSTGQQLISDPIGDTDYDFIDIVSGGWKTQLLKSTNSPQILQNRHKSRDIDRIYWGNGIWNLK